MEELKTILGTDIPISTRGVFYICDYDYKNPSLTVVAEGLFDLVMDALDAYANTRNPESQLVTGKDYNELITNLHILHKNIENKAWVEDLAEYL